jgi:hypothetical protein
VRHASITGVRPCARPIHSKDRVSAPRGRTR